MNRILGIELRRSAASGALLVLLIAGAATLYAAPSRWSVSWMALSMVQREYTVLLWPLAIAAGAWQGRREHKSNVAELFSSAPRPHAQRMVPILGALAIVVVGAYAVITAMGVPWIIDTARYLPVEAFVVAAVGALSMVAGVWLGLAVGRTLPYVVTAPAVAVAGIGLLMVMGVGREDPSSYVFSPMNGMSLYTDYQTVDNRVSAAQAIWLLALSVAGVVLVMAGSWRTRVAALLPAALGAAASIMVVPHGAAFVAHPIDPVAREQVCADGIPQVCVSRVHSAMLPEVTTVARNALAIVAALPDPPTAAREDTTTFDPLETAPHEKGVILLDIRSGADGKLAHPELLTLRMLEAAVSPDVDCSEGVDSEVQRAAAYWLLGREPLPGPTVDPVEIYESPEINAEAVQLWRGLQQLPKDEAAARVGSVRQAALACKSVEGLLSRSAAR